MIDLLPADAPPGHLFVPTIDTRPVYAYRAKRAFRTSAGFVGHRGDYIRRYAPESYGVIPGRVFARWTRAGLGRGRSGRALRK